MITDDTPYWSHCGPDCPIHPDAITNVFLTDHTLKITHHNFDQIEITIALKLYGILTSFLLLIGLMVTGLGISSSEI